MGLNIFSCFFRKFQMLLVIYTDNLLPSTDDARFRDRELHDFEKIDFIHGYGLKNVKDSAEACGGFCVINHENDIYSATVIIPVLNP